MISSSFEDSSASGLPLSYEELADNFAKLTSTNQMLRRRADRTELILGSATDHAIITLNLGGRITGWNRGAECVLGHTEMQAMGQSGAIVFTAEDRDAGVFIDELCKSLEQGRAANERWHLRRDGTRFWASGTMVPLLDSTGRACGFLNIMRDSTAAREAEERAEFLLAETRHWAKNAFATVQAVALQTARGAGPGQDFGPALHARLAALARSHDLLESEQTMLDEVVGRALEPYSATGRTTTAGPSVFLAGRTAAALGSIFHELATNAVKYGALSSSEGSVEVTWALEQAGVGSTPGVAIAWRECGGPAVSLPKRRGFGSRMIEQGLAQEPGGTSRLEFAPNGVSCFIHLPPGPARP